MDEMKKEDMSQKVRVSLDKRCTQQELDNLVLIRTKSETATQAARPDAIPDGTPQDKAAAFIHGALALKAESRLLENLWWDEMTKKYDLSGTTWIDFKTCEFYQLKEKAD